MAQDARTGGAEELSRPTIFALSSGALPAAIAVVRISGPGAFEALRCLVGHVPQPRRATLAALREGEDLLDHGLVLAFPGPASVTGEDLAELHLHGGRATVARVLGALERLPGLVPAQPGAFTRRAFDNGRIDLGEAEGLADLLAAETEMQRRAALAATSGGPARLIAEWLGRTLALSARAEALIDYDEDGDVASDASLAGDIEDLRADMLAWLARPSAERLRDGVRVAIAGPANAGKSSLFNALTGRDAAIVSEIAGTTRDRIEANVTFDGIPFVLMDTAGLRAASSDSIEQIGIARARATVEESDIVIWLGDEMADFPSRAIAVRARCDLDGRDRDDGRLGVSVKTGDGLSALVSLILQRARTSLPSEGETVLNRRQRSLVREAVDALGTSDDVLLIGEGLRVARSALNRFTGQDATEAMLDNLFARFCVGK